MSEVIPWDQIKLKQLKEYLKTNEEPIRTHRIPWRGDQLVEFDVFKVPTKILSYNFYNTRIRAELLGYLHNHNQEFDPKNTGQQKEVQNILLNSKYFGGLNTQRLSDDLQNRGQLDPAISTPDGVLIDGNRRLAILRQLEENYKNGQFSEMEICVLPENATQDDLKALEMRLQMTKSFRVGYGDFNIALEFRYLFKELDWPAEQIEDITGDYYKVRKILDMIKIIDMIDECLLLVEPRGKYENQYTLLNKGWESFANLYNLLKWTERNEPDAIEKLTNRKIYGFQIIMSPETTYSDVRDFYRILKEDGSREKLEKLSDTLQGKNLEHPLELSRIKQEVKYLESAQMTWQEIHESPSKIAKAVLKKLNTIKVDRVERNDHSLLNTLDHIIEKASSLRKKIK